LAPDVKVELVERPEGHHRSRVHENVATAVAIEHDRGGAAHFVWVG
jgi:hypothetical protein